MFFWSLQITIISIIMIFLVHHLLLFFKSTLTVPKIKDLVNIPSQKYENIYNIMNRGSVYEFGSGSGSGSGSGPGINNIKNITTDIKKETTNEINSMKNELKSFMKKQLQSDVTSIDTLNSFSEYSSGSISGSNNYSIY
jgi:hypothetical protein